MCLFPKLRYKNTQEGYEAFYDPVTKKGWLNTRISLEFTLMYPNAEEFIATFSNYPPIIRVVYQKTVTNPNNSLLQSNPVDDSEETRKRKKQAPQQTATAKLMTYLIARNDDQAVTSTQYPVNAFLTGIAPTLKTLNAFYLNLAKLEILYTVQQYEIKCCEEHSHHRVFPNLLRCVTPQCDQHSISSNSTPNQLLSPAEILQEHPVYQGQHEPPVLSSSNGLLPNYCEEGTAAQRIQSMEFSGVNYIIAWELMCQRYNNPGLLVNNHVQGLFSLPNLAKESSADLRILISNIAKHLRSFEVLILRKLDEKATEVCHLLK
ncbi:Protein of unknown function (DUF1759) [Popillia japonica]|uniref:Uncharacterized protein n=1 Tax=Popillia japonica TaxID=7064 RepID=A0AAW1JE07_POPJA